MKKHLTTILTFAIVFTSCKNEKNIKNEINKSENEVQNLSVKKIEKNNDSILNTQKDDFDWVKSTSLKQKLITKLKENNIRQDSLIVDYLTAYGELIDEYNNKLINKSEYDLLNTLAYINNEDIEQSVLDFKEQVENHGLSIKSSEGMIYLEKNTDFIKSNTIELLDSISTKFLDLYCHEIEYKCCEDAGIIISKKEIVNRIINWGYLTEKAIGTNYLSISKNEFNRNLSLLFMGLDNTPSFDYVTGKYNDESFKLMEKIINEFPNSIANKEFKIFTEIIKTENFEQTEKVNEYYKTRFK